MTFRVAFCCSLLVAVAACSGKETPKTELGRTTAEGSVAPELSPAAKASLDSGNVLFRKQAYAAALAQYEAAAKASPQHAAPLFGVYMVGRATNNKALADSAMVGIRARNALPPHDLPDSATLKKMHAKPPAMIGRLRQT